MALRRERRTLIPTSGTRASPQRLAAMVEAMRPLFLGRELRDLAFVPEYDLLFFFERQRCDATPGAALISWHPQWARFHPVGRRYRALEFREAAFVRSLRRALAGARLDHLAARAGDRAIDMRFVRRDDSGEHVHEVHFELYGTHANTFLCERGIVTGALFPERKRAQQLKPGTTYVAAELQAHDANSLREALPIGGFDILQWTVEMLHGSAENERLELLRAHFARELERRAQKAQRRLQGLEVQARAAERAEDLMRMADLLKASAHEIRRGASEAEVTDWYQDPVVRVSVPLDPRLGPHENAEKLYKKSRRLLAARAVAEQECTRGRRELASLDTSLQTLRSKDDPGELLAFAEQLRTDGVLPKTVARTHRAEPSHESLPYRRFRSVDGLEIRVGRNARANDRLSFVLSKGNDYWLHSALGAGSHVVVPLARDQQIPIETLHDAACLALHFSAAKSLGGDVHVARIKQLRRLKGAAPGQVALQSAKSLRLRPEPERLQRLLRGAREEEDYQAPPGHAPQNVPE